MNYKTIPSKILTPKQITNRQIKQAMDRLNNRLRKVSGNESPNELLWKRQVN